jgi:ParB family chromosome partitioning protein
LKDLAESIRMYGILQPLVVTRKEIAKEDGGLSVEYELISGERRLRASKIAGLAQVPALIRNSEEDARVKLELAIIENLQREDLNPVDRARAFQRLVDEFNFKHIQIAEKMGKSREYVTNTLRLLTLPAFIIDGLSAGVISEGHARPLMMLNSRPEEQNVLFKEITYKKLTVREAESIARKIAVEKVRNKETFPSQEILEMEGKLAESLGTRVHIERKQAGGKIVIDFFSPDDLRYIYDIVKSNKAKSPQELLDRHISRTETAPVVSAGAPLSRVAQEIVPATVADSSLPAVVNASEAEVLTSQEESAVGIDDRSPQEIKKESEEPEDIYSLKNFSI